MFVIASNASTPRTYIHSSICFTRNGGETIVPSACSRRGGARSYRLMLLLVVTSRRHRLRTAGASHLSGRIDAESAQEREVVHVDAELHLAVALDQHARGWFGRGRFDVIAVEAVQADGGIENHVEVVALVADPLNVFVDVVGARDRIVDGRPELLQELLDFVVQGFVPG